MRATTTPLDRSEAVNLARNILTQQGCLGITSRGVQVLSEAVVAMDAALAAPQPQALMPQGNALNQVACEVLAEVERATRKFPTWPTDPLHALAVLGEEFGELTKDMLQLTYEPHKTSMSNVRTEALQTAAMALRLIMSLERYEYQPSVQHRQDQREGSENG